MNRLIQQASKEILAADPRWHFRKEKSQVDYNDSGKGTLSVPKLIQKEPCFKKPEPASHSEKKTLIFSDWTAALWSKHHIKEVNELIDYLLEQGFNLLIEQGQQLVPLKNHLTLEQLNQMTPVSSQKLIELAAAQHLTQDQLYLLDDLELTRLSEEKDQTEPVLKFSDYSKTRHQSLLKNLIPQKYKSALLETFPPPRHYIDIATQVFGLRTEFQYKDLTLEATELNQLMQQKQLNKEDFHFNYASLKDLNSISLNSAPVDPEQILVLLKECNQLENLSLSDGSRIKKEHLEAPCLAALKSLTIHNGAKEYSKLLSLAPSLTELSLDLNQYQETPEDRLFPNSNLNQLEILSLQSCTLSAQALQQILSHTPNLKNLSLHCPDLSGPLLIPELPLLESLRYGNRSAPSSRPLQGLLKSATHLKTLSLPKLAADAFSTTPELPCLEKLDLSYEISRRALHTLLQGATQLKQLNFQMCTLSDERIPGVHLASLEKIEVWRSNLSSQDLENLLQGAPQLKSLSLSQCQTLSNHLTVPVLDSLESLHLSNINLSTQSLANILRQAKNLKNLTIRNCPQFEEAQLSKELKELISKVPNTNFSLPSFGRPANDSLLIDTRTDELPSLKAKIHFFPLNQKEDLLNADLYRKSSFNTISIADECTAEDAFRLHNQGDLKLRDCLALRVNAAQFQQAQNQAKTHELPQALGIEELILNNEWVALPSLRPDETITHLYADPENAAIELCYSERDNLYYVRSNQMLKVRFKYIVQLAAGQTASLPAGIERLKTKYLNYEQGALKFEGEHLKGKDYLHALQTQNKGACRHRTLALKAEIEEKYPQYPSRIITNDLHSFLEVCVDNQWVTCDVGGYGVALLDNSLAPSIPNTTLAQEAPPSEAPIPPERLKRFATWEPQSDLKPTLPAYCQELLQKTDQKKQLLECASEQELQALFSAVYQHCKSVSRPVFCINSPEDLICASSYMQLSGASRKGRLVKGPGGPLYEFLKTGYPKDNPPVLLVNYSRFKAPDLVRFNSLLDVLAKVDGIELPLGTQVLGFMNPYNPKVRFGSDLTSRFDKRRKPPFSDEDLAAFRPPDLQSDTGPIQERVRINLFHASDWKERLLGRWVLNGKELYFEEGLLIPALQAKKPLLIENGLWDNAEFQQFWQLLSLTQTPAQPMGSPAAQYEIPQYFKKEGYDWNTLIQTLQWDKNLQAGALTLNPTQLSQFFQRYEYEDRNLKLLPGLLQVHADTLANRSLELNVTRSLSEDEWAELLTKAKTLNIKLHLHCAPEVDLPACFQSQAAAVASPQDQTPWLDCALTSTDIDTTVAQLENSIHPLVLDISECQESDLLVQITGALKEESLDFEFKQRKGALLQALEEDKTVVLKGSFSEELKDALAPLLLSRKAAKNPSGKIILLSQNTLYGFMPHEQKQISPQEKLQFLTPIQAEAAQLLSPERLASESLAQLKARLYYLKRHPGQASDKAWEGLYHLPAPSPLAPFEPERSKELAAACIQQRLEAVHSVLAEQPFVFLTGLTGVGKTTFVAKHLAQTAHLYQGESKLKLWAQDKRPEQKILFIDEANLSPTHWSEMEGLFNNPPGILIDGEYFPLDKQHKLVFAGNPVTYGDDRTLAPFFARHGNTVLFDPLPLATVYEDILAPIFAPLPSLSSQTATLCQPLLKAYQLLCQYATDEVLMSPRDLQTMSLLICAYCQQHPEANPQQVAHYYAYQLSLPLVPQSQKIHFQRQFGLPTALKPTSAVEPSTDFLITPSRQDLTQLLHDLFMLRQFKRDSKEEVNRFGGLGGMIIEGEPGIGKSELVTQILAQNGYQELHSPYAQDPIPERAFYRIPASMGLEEKEQLLLKAFHEGSVVVIDEINSSPMMERLLNALLMGTTPEGEQAKNPGFMVIGTQNPISMAGRVAASTALSRRLITLQLPLYTAEEMLAILISKGLEEERAQELIRAFHYQLQQAQNKGLSPAPCVRDLLKAADELIKASSKQQDLEAELPNEPVGSMKKQGKNYSFLLNAAATLCTGLSLAAVVVAVLALALVISIAPLGIAALFGVGLCTAPLAFSLFKAARKPKAEEPLVDADEPPSELGPTPS